MIQFTRAERALLQVFWANRGRVLGREMLLETISGVESEVADRSVDFIIHRLRRKLKDPARDPRYIVTRYGEGYIWIGPSHHEERSSSGAFIVVGPVHGLRFAEEWGNQARRFAKALVHEMNRNTARELPVVLDADCPATERFSGDPPEFAVSLDFVEIDRHSLDCAFTLRRFKNDRSIKAGRMSIGSGRSHDTSAEARAAPVARDLIYAAWFSLQDADPEEPPPDLRPLPVSLHEASEVMAAGNEPWADARRRLRRHLREAPEDFYAQIALAATLHSQYVISGERLLAESDERKANDAEIERLTRLALPHLRPDGSHVFIAAKLLYFSNAANRDRALSIAREAFETTTALATAFTVQAQLQAWEGDLDHALRLYDQALELSEHGTTFHIYLLVLKSQAAMAADPMASDVVDQLYTVKPATRRELGLFLAPTNAIDVSNEVQSALDAMNEKRARGALRSLHYVTTRHFQLEAHRHNIMRRPVELLAHRFGAAIVPDDVRSEVPADLLSII